MKAWEARSLATRESDTKYRQVINVIREVAASGHLYAQIPSGLIFQDLEKFLISDGYSVTQGDERDPGFYVSWGDATRKEEK